MKSILILAAVLLSGHWAIAQGTVKLKGVVRNQGNDSIFVRYNNSRLIYDPVEFAARLDEGAFEYTFNVKEEFTPVTIQHGSDFAELIVQAGDSLVMTADAQDSLWTYSFTGRGSDKANYLAKHAKDMGLVDRYAIKMSKYQSKDAKSFVEGMNTEERDELSYLEKNKAGLPENFVQYLRASYKYFTYFCRYQYPMLHEVVKNKSYNITSIPEANYDAVKDIPPVFADSLMGVIPYRLYVDMYYRMQLEAAGYRNDTGNVFRVQDSITKLAVKHMPPATAEYVVAIALYSALRNMPLKMAEERIAAFRKRWPKSVYKDDIEAQYSIAKRLAVGEKAFDFTFSTPQGKTGKLSDFRGKIVLLGFWSSEYRQCITEMRAAAQMANKYKDHDIVFLYVSLDTDEFPWIAAIEQHKMSGIHTREDGGWKSFLAKIYGIQALPAFFLIDREGRFALKQTPFPSQSGIMAPTVDALLAMPYAPGVKEEKPSKEKG